MRLVRTVQRWMTGALRPSPEDIARLVAMLGDRRAEIGDLLARANSGGQQCG